MLVKVSSSFSEPRRVLGGVPQGSILGFFLFICSIDSFEASSTDLNNRHGESGSPTLVCGELVLNKC